MNLVTHEPKMEPPWARLSLFSPANPALKALNGYENSTIWTFEHLAAHQPLALFNLSTDRLFAQSGHGRCQCDGHQGRGADRWLGHILILRAGMNPRQTL